MTARYLVGDVHEQLATLEPASVDLVLSSPPFLALRSYLPADHPDKGKEIGSEPTPGEFLDTILDVVEACARVLTPHGSLVFEFGDTYAGSTMKGGEPIGGSWGVGTRTTAIDNRGKTEGWPLDKSLTLIPESFAWALAYGRNPWTGRTTDPWRIRNFCPWVRPNPPVGALGDKFRPGTSYLTVACKARDRWFDLDAVRGPIGENTHARTAKGVDSRTSTGKTADDERRGGNWSTLDTQHLSNGAPPLDWFNIPTQPYAGSHYATWPEKLALPFIESMCPRQVCRVCGEPRRRLVGEAEYVNSKTGKPLTTRHFDGERRSEGENHWDTEGQGDRAAVRFTETLGWSDCGCELHTQDADCPVQVHERWRSGLVLDPFAGSGTTLQVATGCGRDAIGIDLDERNLDLARERIGMFLVEEVPPDIGLVSP